MSFANNDWPRLRRVHSVRVADARRATTSPHRRRLLFESGTLGDVSCQEEIGIEHNNVIWSAEGVVKRRFTYNEPVREVKWVYLPHRCLCTFLASRLSFYLPNGDVYDAPLSQEEELHAVWPLPYGLLIEGNRRYLYLRELYEEMHLIDFFNTAGEESFPGKLVWSSTDLPIVISQKGPTILIWVLKFGAVDSISFGPFCTPTPKRRSMRENAATLTKLYTQTVCRVRKGETPYVPEYIFDLPLAEEVLPRHSPVVPGERCAASFFHFVQKQDMVCVDAWEEATSACIAGANHGRSIMIAVHCRRSRRVYYCLADKSHFSPDCSGQTGLLREARQSFKFEKSQPDVRSIGSLNPFPRHLGKENLAERFFVAHRTNGEIEIYQGEVERGPDPTQALSLGIARIEDVNFNIDVPHRPLRSDGRSALSGADVEVVDVVGQCLTIAEPNALHRYRINIRPRDELAVECFFVVREIDISLYKETAKLWIGKHLGDMLAKSGDWEGFCKALHSALDMEFFAPDFPAVQVPALWPAELHESSYNILLGLHDVYENCKFDTTRWIDLKRMAHLLSSMSANLGTVLYLDLYARDFTPEVMERDFGIALPAYLDLVYGSFKSRILQQEPANKQFALLDAMRPRGSSKKGTPTFSSSVGIESSRFTTLGDVIATVRAHTEETHPSRSSDWRRLNYLSCAKDVVEIIMKKRWDHTVIKTLPFGFGLPIQEMLRALKESPPEGTAAAPTMGDISATIGPEPEEMDFPIEPCLMRCPDEERQFYGREFKARCGQVVRHPMECPENTVLPSNPPTPQQRLKDGLDDVMTAIGRQRFNKDNRLEEVRKALNTVLPQELHVAVGPDNGEQLQERIQDRLTALALRTAATTIGRGAFALRTVCSTADEPDIIPELCLSGVVPGKDQLHRLGQTEAEEEKLKKLTEWADFHQAVSSALKAKPDVAFARRFADMSERQLTGRQKLAGYWFAAGLHSRLTKAHIPEISALLGTQHVLMQISVILGLSVSLRGSQDAEAERLAFLHLPNYHPRSFPEAEWCSPPVQTAMLLSIGFLHVGSKHHTTTKRMLDELGRRPGGKPPEILADVPCGGVTTDRESYALAAGFAIGLVNLGLGDKLQGYYFDCIIHKLWRYMIGGHDPRIKVTDIADFQAPPNTLLGPGGVPWNDDLDLQETTDEIGFLHDKLNYEHMPRGLESEQASLIISQSNVVLESEDLDTDVTSPAATFALMLMFLKTHDQRIADLFVVPSTEFELDRIRYDFVLHRVLAKALVLWYDILPHEEWIASFLPELMTQHRLDDYFKPFTPQRMHDIGKAHLFGVAGACLAIGIRFASTGNKAARQLLSGYMMKLLHCKHVAMNGVANPLETFDKIDKKMVETVMSLVALALGLVMAGSGNLETFRLLDCLRKRVSSSASLKELTTDISYGDYMAVTMAIGFLFLGGGQQGFKTDNFSVACLLMSLYPHFPMLITDNQTHLQARPLLVDWALMLERPQAFRHLYVLAAENRVLSAVDVDSGAHVLAKIKVAQRVPRRRVPPKSDEAGRQDCDGDHIMMEMIPLAERDYLILDQELGTPCLLPERHLVASVSVMGSRYHRSRITGYGLDHVYKTHRIYVKRKRWMLPYERDPCGLELRSQAFLQEDPSEEIRDHYADLIALFQKYQVDSVFAGFAKAFCSETRMRHPQLRDFVLFCRGVLSECVDQDKQEMLNAYVQLWTLLQRCKEFGCSDASSLGAALTCSPRSEIEVTLWMMNFVAVEEFYKGDLIRAVLKEHEKKIAYIHRLPFPLIQPVFVKEMKHQLWQLFISHNFVAESVTPAEPVKLLSYYDRSYHHGWPLACPSKQLLFNCFLAMTEAELSNHTGKPDRGPYIQELYLLNY